MNLLASPEWIDFLMQIRNAQDELKNPEIIWFRGHSNAANYLLPSLLRYKNGLELEQKAFHKFRRFADKVFHNTESEWETLFDMQHYGIPTRLLDWSENLGIALFFAVNDYNRNLKRDAAVYLLNPIELNKESGVEKIYRLPYEETAFSYSKVYWDKKPFKANAPIAIEPIFKNDRMIAQRGTFTVHHDRIEPIEKDFPNAIRKVILPYNAIPSAQEFLKIANINEFSVFPDLSGISDYINKDLGLTPRWA